MASYETPGKPNLGMLLRQKRPFSRNPLFDARFYQESLEGPFFDLIAPQEGFVGLLGVGTDITEDATFHTTTDHFGTAGTRLAIGTVTVELSVVGVSRGGFGDIFCIFDFRP